MEINKIEEIDFYTDRIRVPNGWLYRTIIARNINGTFVHTVFVPDKTIHRK